MVISSHGQQWGPLVPELVYTPILYILYWATKLSNYDIKGSGDITKLSKEPKYWKIKKKGNFWWIVLQWNPYLLNLNNIRLGNNLFQICFGHSRIWRNHWKLDLKTCHMVWYWHILSGFPSNTSHDTAIAAVH